MYKKLKIKSKCKMPKKKKPAKKREEKEKHQVKIDKEPKKQLSISAIQDGTVIDHIPADATFKVVEILKLWNHNEIVSIATNLQSSTLGKKGIVKVANKFLTETEVNKIAVVAPDATVNIIRNYNVKQKIKVKVPQLIEEVIRCSNPVCITNSEKVKTKFYTIQNNPLKIKCHYCERLIKKEDIDIA